LGGEGSEVRVGRGGEGRGGGCIVVSSVRRDMLVNEQAGVGLLWSRSDVYCHYNTAYCKNTVVYCTVVVLNTTRSSM
jgi:hypothetical protein